MRWIYILHMSKEQAFSKSKSLDNKDARYAKKSRSYITSWIEIATLEEDTDPDTDVYGEGRM